MWYKCQLTYRVKISIVYKRTAKRSFTMEKKFKTYAEFYEFYLNEHKLPTTKLFHCVGTTLGLICLSMAILKSDYLFVWLGVFLGYLFPWISHFFIEKNRPATFKYPLRSLFSDFRMFFEIITFQRKLRDWLEVSLTASLSSSFVLFGIIDREKLKFFICIHILNFF